METLTSYLTQLNLSTMQSIYQEEANACLMSGASYEAYLQRLCEQEVLSRLNRKIQLCIQKAQFPSLKTLDVFDFTRIPQIDKQHVFQLMQGDFATRSENIVALGNSGTGKTHLALAIGLTFCQRGESVLFQTAAHLVHSLMEAHDEKKLLKFKKKLNSYTLLIIDELGYVPFSKTGAELLFEVFSERYEQKSVVITSNLPFEEWPQVFGCHRLTGALLDRLTHRSHILLMNGESYRVSGCKEVG